MKSVYLTHWDCCEITTRQGAVLLAHLAGPNPPALERNHKLTTDTLLERMWLIRDPETLHTELTPRGRLAAFRSASAFLEKGMPSPKRSAPALVPENQEENVT